MTPLDKAVHTAGGHIVLCGLEGLGVRTLEELQRLGERCVVVTRHVQPRYRDAVRTLVETIVEGDPRDPDVLRQAGIERARAIVLTEDDDVANIHVALTAVQLRPGIHVVMRTFDEDFARHVEMLLPDVVAMSSSALAAPGFVTALLDADAEERWIEVLGRTLVVRRAAADDPAVLVPLADDTRDPVELFPRQGQRLLCLVDAAGEPAHTQSARPAGRGTALPRTRSISWLRRVDRQFWVLGAVLALITLGSAAVLVGWARLDLVEAIYDVVGAFFGGVDPTVVQNDTSLKLFAILLTLFGAAALAVFYGLIADIVLSARISEPVGPTGDGCQGPRHRDRPRFHRLPGGVAGARSRRRGGGRRAASRRALRGSRPVAAHPGGDHRCPRPAGALRAARGPCPGHPGVHRR